MIKRILVSQPQPTSEKSPYYDLAKKLNVEFVFHPFVRVERLPAKEFRQQRINVLDYTAIVMTSRHAIDHFFNLCQEMRVAIPVTMKYFCIAETVALYLQKYIQYRKRKIFFSETGKMEDIIPLMLKHKNEKYFVPQSETHNNSLSLLLDSKSLLHKEGIMYRTVSNNFAPDEPLNFDMVLLFSPSGVQALLDNFPNFQQGSIAIATYGATTAKAVNDAGLRLDLDINQHPNIMAALTEYISKVNEKA